ncbi:Ribonuclease H-like domain containing protein [Russula decolorans]
MPPDAFLDRFLPSHSISIPEGTPNFQAGMFTSLLPPTGATSATDAADATGATGSSGATKPTPYKAIKDSLQAYLSALDICITAWSDEEAENSRFPFKIRPDCSVYAKEISPEFTNSSLVEFFIEHKSQPNMDPFIVPKSKPSTLPTTLCTNPFVKDSTEAISTLGQMTSYVTSHLGSQFRTHAFFVLIVHNYARIIRWDRGGAVVTAPIRFNEEDHLFNFFIRYNYADSYIRGSDSSVRAPKPKELCDATQCINEFRDPGSDRGKAKKFLVVSVPSGEESNHSKKRVFLKDSWRININDMPREGDSYAILHKERIPNIAECLDSGDIGDGTYHSTQTHLFVDADWVTSPKPVVEFTPHRHYRIVLDTIGIPLEQFKCSRDMVRAIRASLIAHEAAYTRCGILHRDISPSNILISDNVDGGLLIDWDLCKNVNSTEHKARRAASTLMNWNQGTWQFMAADLIKDPTISQTFVHDLESAFYVMFWLSLKYLPNSYAPSKRGSVLSTVFNPIPVDSLLSPILPTNSDSDHNSDSHSESGIGSKVDWMANNDDVDIFKVTGNNPLSVLLPSLKKLLGFRHVSANMISDTINTIFNEGPDPDLLLKFSKKRNVEYSQVLKRLDDALQEQWPHDDCARLQRIALPANLQIAALSASKRSRIFFKRRSSHHCYPHFTEMPRRSAADKATSDKTAVSKATPQQAPKNTRKENPNAPEKGRAVTSRTTGPSLARKKRMALSVTPHFQSGQVGGGNEFDFPDKSYEDDDTQGTVDSQAATQALDIVHFFVVYGKEEEKKRVCKICGEKYGFSEVPKGVDNYFYGMGTGFLNLRKHLASKHTAAYDKAIVENNWNYCLSNEVKSGKSNTVEARKHSLPPFTQASLIDYIIHFVVADDQSIRVVECPEFRDLCMLLRPSLQDKEIPRRNRVREGIIEQWHKWFDSLKRELADSLGRISLTADVWSSGNFSSYLALTCHWISDKGPNGSLLLKSALIGFHRLKNKHTGKNIARNILHLLKRAGITSKIGHFTLDNAENNATAMRELEALLKLHDDDIEFDHLNNRIRCYPHIINICSSHIIASSTRISKRFLETLKSEFASDLVYSNIEGDEDDEDDEDGKDDDDSRLFARKIPELTLDEEQFDILDDKVRAWYIGLKRDPIKRACRIVRIVRSSDQRKQAFKKVINTGNHSGWFRSHDNEVIELPDLELLRDVKTRWDSVYCMIERLLVLRPAIDFFFSMKVHGLTEYKLTDLDWELLDALYAVLAVPHMVQQIMSAESMPVLSGAVPSFEIFMTRWEKLRSKFPELKPLVDVGLEWAEKYYKRMDDTDAYVVAMFLNPCIRFEWIARNWEGKYIKRAKTLIIEAMSKYRSRRSSGTLSAAPQALAQRAPATPLKSRKPSRSKAVSRFQLDTHIVDELLDSVDASPHQGTVQEEFDKYTAASLSPLETDILHFWEINKTEFPTLFAIALDYLPIQASSVPCERVFSSAKETDTVKRNRIHPVLMEALQTLKFSLKKERFNFTSGWQTAPSKMKRMGNAGTTKDLLAHLLTGNRQATTDALLHALSDGDDDDDDDGNGDDGEFEDGLHNDDVEDDDDDDDDE